VRAIVIAPCCCASDQGIEPAEKMGGVHRRARRRSINCYVDRAGAAIRIDILDLRVGMIVPGTQHQSTAATNLHFATDIGLCARPIKMMTGDDATVENQLEVIDRHDGPQRCVVRQDGRLRQCNVIPPDVCRRSPNPVRGR
jgi:hypothetical protein